MIRIDIRQPFALFKMVEIGNPLLSYPLAPPSTVFGFLRKITGGESINYQNTRLAISGHYAGIARHIVQNHMRRKGDSKYMSNVIPTEDLFDAVHHIHVDSPRFENAIEKSVGNARRLGRTENLITSVEITRVSAAEVSPLSVRPSSLEDIETEKLYVPVATGVKDVAVFRIPVDSDQELFSKGVLKMHKKQLLYLSSGLFRNAMIRSGNSITVSSDDAGRTFILEWVT